MKRSSRGYGLLRAAETETSKKDQQRKTAISDWTNDSQDGGNNNNNNESSERIEIRHGYPVRFKCLDAAAALEATESLDANLLTVYFDYELTMPRDSTSTFTENMRALEWSVLWNVVDTIGLGKCDFEKQTIAMSSNQQGRRSWRKSRTRRRTQDIVEPLDTSPSYILSMSSDPEDEIDTDAVVCQFTANTDPSNLCVPMKGAMTILYTGNEPEIIQNFVQTEVQNVMAQSIVLVEDIKAASYVGIRDELDTQNDDRSSFNGIGLGFAVCVGFVVVAIFGLLAGLSLRRKRLRRVKELEKLELCESDPSSTGHTIPNLEEVKTTSSDSSEHDASTVDMSKNLAIANSFDFHAEYPPEALEQDGIMFEQPVSSTVAIQSVHLASKRQRKRKKGGKKRKKSLRERVSMAPSGIEPIPEMDGDFASALYGEDGDERGSDFSWSSDDEDDKKPNLFISPTDFPFPSISPHYIPNAKTPRAFFPPDASDSKSSPDSATADVNAIRSIKEVKNDRKQEPPRIRRLPPPWI